MKSQSLIVGDLAIMNGIVARRPSNMSREYWLEYEAPRIGKVYTKKQNTLYGWEYDIDKTKFETPKANVEELMSEDGECLSCKI